MEEIVIVSATRTAVGKFGGSLAKTPAVDLGAIVIKEAIARAGLDHGDIGEVIMGQVLPARTRSAVCGQCRSGEPTPSTSQVSLASQNRPMDATSTSFSASVIDRLTIWQAASSPASLKAILIGVLISAPAIIGYTVFSYRVFRGKARELKYA